MAEHCRTAGAQSLVQTQGRVGGLSDLPPICEGSYVFFPRLYEPYCQSDTWERSLGRGEEEEWVDEHRICFWKRDHGVKGVRIGTRRYVETSSGEKNGG